MILVGVIGIISGIISGMGIGGGTVLIPALVCFLGVTQQQAQGINLIYFLPTATIALVTHKKDKNIEMSVAKPIAIIGLLGAVCGALLAVNLEAEILKKIFGGFLFVMGMSEIFKKDKE